MGANETKDEVLSESCTFDLSNITYVSLIYWVIDKRTGGKRWNYLDVSVASACFILVMSCMFIIIFCVSMICWKINSKEVQFSKKMRKSNWRLTMNIVSQTSLTCFMLFIPLGMLILCPMFGLKIGNLTKMLTAFIVFYPAVEAIITIFIIGDFRNAMFCRKPRQAKSRNVRNSDRSMETKF